MRSSTCGDNQRRRRTARDSQPSNTQRHTRRPNRGEHHHNRSYHGHRRLLCRPRHPRTPPRAAYRPPRLHSHHLHTSLLNQRGRVYSRADPARSTHTHCPLQRNRAPKTARVLGRTPPPGFRHQKSRAGKYPSGPSRNSRRQPRGEHRLGSLRSVRNIGGVGGAGLSSRRGHTIAERAVRA